MFSYFDKYVYSSKDNFPVAECMIQNRNEFGVLDAETIYQVLCIDIRFPYERRITYAKPYIYKEKDGSLFYGWTSVYTNEIFGNVEKSCQFCDEFVVGFIIADEKCQEEDREWFETFKRTIDKQRE